MDIDYQQKSQEISDWLKITVEQAGFSKVIVAVSGGVDSAASLSLAVKALGAENVYAVLLPYGEMSKASLEHGKLVAEKAGLPKVHVFIRDIKNAVDVLSSSSECEGRIEKFSTHSVRSNNKSMGDLRKGNIMARVRMIYLFDLAKQLGALVVGTENKTEHFLGYFTRFGDEASDIEPIRGLYKTQVFALAKYLGVPKEIIDKAPSAGLWEGQSDEGEFGFSYLQADTILHLAFDEYMRNGDIVKSGIDEKIVRKVLEFVDKNNFKHHVPHIFGK